MFPVDFPDKSDKWKKYGFSGQLDKQAMNKAFTKETDNDDEKETRLYAVAGRFDRTFPEITVRAGCAGKFIYLPPEEVFEGNFFGDFPKEWKENIRFAEETPRRIIPHIRRFFGEERI